MKKISQVVWTKGSQRTPYMKGAFYGVEADLSNWLQTIPATGDGSYMVTRMIYFKKSDDAAYARPSLAGFTYVYARYEGSMNGEALWYKPTTCVNLADNCREGLMRVALYGGKPQILDMKDKNTTRMVPSKVSSAPTTTRSPRVRTCPTHRNTRSPHRPPPGQHTLSSLLTPHRRPPPGQHTLSLVKIPRTAVRSPCICDARRCMAIATGEKSQLQVGMSYYSHPWMHSFKK